MPAERLIISDISDISDQSCSLTRKGEQMDGRVVLVLGTIGSGKTSMCRELAAELGTEPLIEMAQEDGNPYLEDFYLDMKRYSAILQIDQLTRRFSQHKLAQNKVMAGLGHAVLDGGFWLDTCFARLIYKSGMMEDREYDTYRRLFAEMTMFVGYPHIIIRLSALPAVAYERVQRRATEKPERRGEAVKVTREYLGALDQEIEALCREMAKMGVEVITTFWDEDRNTPAQRQQAVQGLAQRVRACKPPDPFLANWRRSIEP